MPMRDVPERCLIVDLTEKVEGTFHAPLSKPVRPAEYQQSIRATRLAYRRYIRKVQLEALAAKKATEALSTKGVTNAVTK